MSIDRHLFVKKGKNALPELGLSKKAQLEVETFVLRFESFVAKAMHGYEVPAMEIYDEPGPPEAQGLRGSVVHRIQGRGLLRGCRFIRCSVM